MGYLLLFLLMSSLLLFRNEDVQFLVNVRRRIIRNISDLPVFTMLFAIKHSNLKEEMQDKRKKSGSFQPGAFAFAADRQEGNKNHAAWKSCVGNFHRNEIRSFPTVTTSKLHLFLQLKRNYKMYSLPSLTLL